MGQKVSPVGLRIGVIRDWESRWYAEKEYGDLLLEDVAIRKLIFKECADCLVSRVEIERSKNRVNLIIRTARPGMFVGSDGSKIEELKKELTKLSAGKDINIKIVEVANPDLDARLVALKIVKMLEERQSFRTAQKRAIQQTMRTTILSSFWHQHNYSSSFTATSSAAGASTGASFASGAGAAVSCLL